jgi:hypothetical protein
VRHKVSLFQSFRHISLRSSVLSAALFTIIIGYCSSAVPAEQLPLQTAAQTFPDVLSQTDPLAGAIQLCAATKVAFGISSEEFVTQQNEFWDVEIGGIQALTGAAFTIHRLTDTDAITGSQVFDVNLRTMAYQDGRNIVGSDSFEGVRFYQKAEGQDIWTYQGRASNPMRRTEQGGNSRFKVAEVFGVDIRQKGQSTINSLKRSEVIETSR